MDALLAIATFEGNGDSSRQRQESSGDFGAYDPRQPTQVQKGSGYDQQLYICPVSWCSSQKSISAARSRPTRST